MADAFVNQAATSFSQLLWSKAIKWPLRDQLVFDNVATARATTEGGVRGKSVSFIFPNDIALAITPLDEVINPDSVSMSNTTVNVPIAEYGNTMKSTALARATGMVDLDQVLVNLVGFNAGVSLDTLAATALAASTNIQYANGRAGNSTIVAADVITTRELEKAYASFQLNNVAPLPGGTYGLFAHPWQILDLRLETGAGGFRVGRENGGVSGEDLRRRTEGEWAGFSIMSTNREPFTANVGSGAVVDVYSALAIGADGLAKGYSDYPGYGPDPSVVFGLPVDPMKRTHPISWLHLVGYKIMRTAAVLKINTSASSANNVS